MPPNINLDPRPGYSYTHSSPPAASQLDGGNNSTPAPSGVVTGGYPTRHHSQGVVASHFLAQGGETWIDFLRDGTEQTVNHRPLPNTPTAPESRPQPLASRYTLPNRPPRSDSLSSRSSDRKRRLTTADTPMRRPSSIRMHSNPSAGTSSDPIVVNSSPASMRPLPPPPLPPLPSVMRRPSAEVGRRQSDIVLPPWQPDTGVLQCPVCGRHFTFLFRKHHCRKCGRVVCSSCSPHRITIPRQFIVHPSSNHTLNFVDLTGCDDGNAASSLSSYRNPALGGGEEVRVCNPCVPDPNPNPPPQYHPVALSRYSTHHPTPSQPPYVPPAPPTHPCAYQSSSNAHDAPQIVGLGHTQRPRHPFNNATDNRRAGYHEGADTGERRLPSLPNSGHTHPSQSYHHDAATSRSISRILPDHGQAVQNIGPASLSGFNMFPRSMFTSIEAPPLQPQQAQPTRPRRQIAEEDECPICGNELPAHGPENEDGPRTQHIEECIALHSASPIPTPLTQQISHSLPIQRTRGMSNPNAGNGEGASNANRLSHAARGMFPYVATEKDCTDDDGREAECIICMEDFEPGVKMARLVCWCKFHEHCIQEWWDKKGRGACPTHQLQE